MPAHEFPSSCAPSPVAPNITQGCLSIGGCNYPVSLRSAEGVVIYRYRCMIRARPSRGQREPRPRVKPCRRLSHSGGTVNNAQRRPRSREASLSGMLVAGALNLLILEYIHTFALGSPSSILIAGKLDIVVGRPAFRRPFSCSSAGLASMWVCLERAIRRSR